MSTPIMRKGQAGQAGNPGQFAKGVFAEADDDISFGSEVLTDEEWDRRKAAFLDNPPAVTGTISWQLYDERGDLKAELGSETVDFTQWAHTADGDDLMYIVDDGSSNELGDDAVEALEDAGHITRPAFGDQMVGSYASIDQDEVETYLHARAEAMGTTAPINAEVGESPTQVEARKRRRDEYKNVSNPNAVEADFTDRRAHSTEIDRQTEANLRMMAVQISDAYPEATAFDLEPDTDDQGATYHRIGAVYDSSGTTLGRGADMPEIETTLSQDQYLGRGDTHARRRGQTGPGDYSVQGALSAPITQRYEQSTPFCPVSKSLSKAVGGPVTAWRPLWDDSGEKFTGEVEVIGGNPAESRIITVSAQDSDAREALDWYESRAIARGEGSLA